MRTIWPVKRIDEIAQVKGGKRVPKGYKLERIPTLHPYITVSDFTDDGTVDKSKLKYIEVEVFEQISRYTISSKDIYISIAGTIGKTGFVPDELDGANLTENACKLVLSSEVKKKYLYFFTKSESFTRQAGLNTRVAAQPKLALSRLKTISIPIPPVPEQKRIVAILDQALAGIDTAIANTEKNLANARELFESYLNKVFTQKGEGWVEKTIGDFSEVYDGPHATPKTVNSGPIFLGISALQNGIVNLGKTRHVTDEDFKKWTKRVEPRADDIVFSYETRLGQAAVIPKGLVCCLGRRMGLVRVDRKSIEPKFFLYQYVSPVFRHFLDSKTILGATVDRIPLKDFPSFPFYCPAIQIQERIVEQIDIIATQVTTLGTIYQKKLTALAELKQSILQKAFSGQLTMEKGS